MYLENKQEETEFSYFSFLEHFLCSIKEIANVFMYSVLLSYL